MPIAYSLARSNGSVWLVQRPKDASLMAGMWELPEIHDVDDAEPAVRLKHSILDTNFDVAVYAGSASHGAGRWVGNSGLVRLPLTGLARKILRHFELL